jgi:uncharacterized membrane protein YeiB
MLVAGTYLARYTFNDTVLTSRMFATDPGSRSLNYTLCALGSAITFFCLIGWIAEVTRSSVVTRAFVSAGRMTLTLYILHALVFNLVVNRWQLIRPSGLDVDLVFAGGFWVVAIVVAALWKERFAYGPAEWIYRRFGGSTLPVEPITAPAAPTALR